MVIVIINTIEMQLLWIGDLLGR